MGLFYQEVKIELFFKDQEIIKEATKTIPVVGYKIGIKVRDWTDGRGGTSKHKYTPSVKVVDYGKSSSSRHSKDGDPVIFIYRDGNVTFDYDRKQFDSKEIKYIINFIKHNIINLHKYWFSPDYIKDHNKLTEYQTRVENRLIQNINTYGYKKEIGVIDDEIDY